MKKKNKKKKSHIRIFGIKVKIENIQRIVVMLSVAAIVGTFQSIQHYYLTERETVIVYAKIVEEPRIIDPIRQVAQGVLVVEYYHNGEKHSNQLSSSDIKDRLDEYRLGECVEILLSVEFPWIYKWDSTKPSFKCD